MAHLLAASSIVTGGTTGLISLETTTGSLDSLSEDAQSTTLFGGSTTLTSVVSTVVVSLISSGFLSPNPVAIFLTNVL